MRKRSGDRRLVSQNPIPITNINENNEKIINNEHEISKLIKALPKDIAALDKRFDKLLNEMLFL